MPMGTLVPCWAAVFAILALADQTSGFFEQQPKLISESGNLIIESAYDANITIRLRGHGILKVNDISLTAFLEQAAAENGNSTIGVVGGSKRDIVLRIQTLEVAVQEVKSHFEGRRSVQARLDRLERAPARDMTLNYQRMRRRLLRLEQAVTAHVRRFENDYCASTPCSNGGVCHNELGAFRCTCPDNYQGATCSEDRNECSDFAGTDMGCQNGATCVNTVGGYQCECATGWKGVHCTRRTIDCLAGPAGDLCGHGACVPTNDARGYQCVCEQGWRTNGVSPACTVDVDECREDRPHCSVEPPVPCVNLAGSFMCGQCPAGYEGNGYYCRDVDECALANGGCSTSPMVRCVNTRGSHHCMPCPDGWQGDGRSCNPIDNSAGGTPSYTNGSIINIDCAPGLCHPLAQCRPRNTGTTRCECPAGMVGTGFGRFGCRPATGIDPTAGLNRCRPNLCLNGGTCDDHSGQPVCSCPAGYLPPLCLPADGCASQPCTNGGTCIALGAWFRCRCPATHRGITCESEVRQCGGVLSAADGVLRFPLTPATGTDAVAQYSHNQRCAWLIQTNASMVLDVTFTRFNLEPSTECRSDWLQLHDGASSSAHLIGRFCGAGLPLGGRLQSTHNALYLWFRSDNGTARDGFQLEWQSVAPQCGGRFEIETFGTIKSPGSPGNYPQNRNCEWLLEAPPGKRIELHFFGMQLEHNIDCTADKVTVYDGDSSERSVMLAQYCNTTHPEPLISGANELLVNFHSDSVGTDAGFQIHYSVVEGVPGCGGTWTDTNGEIVSPQRDGRYKPNLQCVYVIRQPVGSRVRVRFNQFDLERSESCYFDYVALYEGATREAPLVGRYCGRQMPPMHISLSNVLTIEMRTDYSIGGEGFRLQYEMVCGRTYTNETGTVTTPMYPNLYDRNSRCSFEIVAPPGKAIVLDFEDFDVEDTDESCSYDYLAVFDGHVNGDAADREPLQKFCGTQKPPQQISTTNVMTLVLRTDGSIQARGFKANYSFTEAGCGGVIKTLGHSIRAPKTEGEQYVKNANCTWLLVAPPNKVVQLQFTSFDLEDTPGRCFFDYVMLKDGDIETGAEMGKFCGSNMPPTERSSGNVMAVQFTSDMSLEGNGFQATYEFLDASQFCGGRLFSPTGTIKSPGWPANYRSNSNCTWTIIAPVGQQVEVNVLDFDFERSYGSCDSAYDYLEFRNGGSESSALLGRYCWNSIPKTIRSHANRMWIHFVSDSSVSAKGFRLQWDATLQGCGGHLRGVDRGSLTSPNYPIPYEEHTTCEWRISVSHGSTVQLDFSDLDLEQQGSCMFDVVEIYDGRNSAATQLGRFCGSTIPQSLNTTSNEVFIRMVSDVSNNGRGFDLRFKTNCNRQLTDLHGVIQSPNNPNNYPHNADCKWSIVAPRGNRIQLTFSEFSLESYSFFSNHHHDSCSFDYLAIDQLNRATGANDTNRYCNQMPKPLLSYTDMVDLRFETDNSGSERGFRLEYTIVGCGSLLRVQPNGVGSLSSPAYPASPANGDSDCQWSIEAPYGNVIELTMNDYDLHLSPNCTQQGVAVASERNVTHAFAARNSTAHAYCGQRPSTQTPDVITSESNRMYVHLYSTVGGYSGRGFNASYRVRPMKCGGYFKGVRGSISSPNYPNNYDNNLDCEWLIEVDSGHNVQLRFSDFSLEQVSYSPEECLVDYVQLYSGNVRDDSKQIARLCGHDVTAANVYNSTSNQMLVVMRTDFSDTLKGFQAQFWTTCGTTIELTADQPDGFITSDMVFRYVDSTECHWTMRAVNPDDRIVITFLEYHNTHAGCESAIHVHQPEVNSSAIAVADRHESADWLCASDRHRTPYTSTSSAISLSVYRALNRAGVDSPDQLRFRLQYSLLSAGCGQHFHSRHGEIASPGYPGTYALGSECVWTIGASLGQQLQLTFASLDVAESERCNEAYVEVRESSAQGKLLGTFCGKQEPPTLRANSFWMKFHAGTVDTGNGFHATYSHERIVELQGEIGELQSPLYPHYDIGSMDVMEYRIMVPVGSIVAVRMHELLGSSVALTIFDRQDDQTTELTRTLGSSSGAVLTIFDGYDDQSTMLTRFTSATLPATSDPPISASTNVIYIRWTNTAEALFRLTWSAHNPNELTANASTQHQQTTNCTKNSLVRIGVREIVNLTSPGFPFGYDANQECLWTLAPVQDGYHVALYFRTVDLEDTSNCAGDSVSVRPGSQIAGPFSAETGSLYCNAQGNGNNGIHGKIHGTPYLQLNFKSDYWGNRTGFAAVANVECGGTLLGPEGSIDKNMTLNDMIGTECTWHIKVRVGRTIRLRWYSLQLQRDPQTNSCDSFLMIRNGPDATTSPYLGTGQYCGNELPEPRVLQTTSNQAVVHFTKGVSRNMLDKFRLTYEEVSNICGGSIELTAGTAGNSSTAETFVQTPNYPNIPHPFTECEWTVVGPHGQVLRIDFYGTYELAAPTSGQKQCDQELVELRDGASPGAPLIGTYCDKKPSTLHTTGNVLRMHYLTQTKMPKNGFKARISVDRCGGSFRETSDTIVSSPSDGSGAETASRGANGKQSVICDYRIHQRPGTTLNITFLELNLYTPWHLHRDESQNCSDRNHLAIFRLKPADATDLGTNVDESDLLGIYCDDEEPVGSIITEHPDVLIRTVMISAAMQSQMPIFRLFYNTSVDRCGGDINAASGAIQSPGYPVGRSNRQYCEWRITVPAGRRVRISVVDFDLPSGPPTASSASPAIWPMRSYFQRLNFYNGMSHGSRIASLSGGEDTSIIQSTDNRMLINMLSRSNAGHRGFRLTFSSDEATLCTGDLATSGQLAGQLSAPQNVSTFDCWYRRNASAPYFVGQGPGGQQATYGTLALDIRTVETRPIRGACTVGMLLPLRVQIEGSRELYAVKSLCTNGTEQRVAQPVLSPLADTSVAVRQNPWLRSYTIDWRLYACGAAAIQVGPNGTVLEQPTTSESVVAEQSVRCAWQLNAGGAAGNGEAAKGAKLLVSMRFADLDCEHEHVSVHNGAYASAPMIERVCGASGERNFSGDISGQAMWVEFHTTRYRPNATRFSITVVSDVATCGGLLMAPNFRFRSPRQSDLSGGDAGSGVSSSQYPNNMQCEWELRARRGYHVRLAFRNRFFIEDSANCSKDVVRVSGENVFADGALQPKVTQLCGRTLPAEPLISSDQTMHVSMQTDAQTTGDGFEAEWSEECGGVYNIIEGAEPIEVYSPNYPQHYDRKAKCNYTLIAPADKYITVEFIDFQLEESSMRGCVYDNLTVYRTPDWTIANATELVGTYCNAGSLRRMRFKTSILLVFQADQYLQERGFHFRVSLDQCGGVVTESQMIRLPRAAPGASQQVDEPDAYLPDLNCVWNITAPSDDYKIVVRFERLELEGSDQCYQDYVELYEGTQIEPEKRRAQLCGNLTAHAPVVNVPSNQAVLRFRSDASNQLGGMEALVQFVQKCDEEIVLTEHMHERVLRKSSQGYKENLDCHYKVTAPEGWAIDMNFTSFHVAPCAAVPANGSKECACDYVEVRDGGGAFAEPIGERRCGYDLPAKLSSTHGALWVRFVTDSEITSTGFEAVFSMRKTECGLTHFELNDTHTVQTLRWPAAGNYQPNERCQWKFTVPPGSQMVLSFDHLDVENAVGMEACTQDYLEIFEEGNNVYLPEGLHSGTVFTGGRQSITNPNFYTHQHFASAPHRYCGHMTPSDLITENTALVVRFRSDKEVQRTGFGITVRTMDACQRNYTSLAGRIASTHLRNCDTHIELPSNYTIALYFTRFMLYANDHTIACSEANAPVKILDDGRLARWDCAGSTPSPFFSNSSRVVLRFHDIGVMQFGMLYDITYVASDRGRGCGGEIYNYGGQISSPLYPAGERQHLECIWTLAVPSNQVIAVQFAVFDMGAKSTCADNYVQLSEPSSMEPQRTFCGGDTPAIYVAQSDMLQVRYKQTVNFSGTGWLLNFMATQPGVAPTW